MTIGQWRGRLRLVRAVEQLAAGQPVTAVAGALGYATPSAFTAMFRAQLGEPPGATSTGRLTGPGSDQSRSLCRISCRPASVIEPDSDG